MGTQKGLLGWWAQAIIQTIHEVRGGENNQHNLSFLDFKNWNYQGTLTTYVCVAKMTPYIGLLWEVAS